MSTLLKRFFYPSSFICIEIEKTDFLVIVCARFFERLIGWRLSLFFADRHVIIVLPRTRWVHQFFSNQDLWVFFLDGQGSINVEQLLPAGGSGYCWRANTVVECLPAYRQQVAQWLNEGGLVRLNDRFG